MNIFRMSCKVSMIFWARGKGETEGDRVRKRKKIKVRREEQ